MEKQKCSLCKKKKSIKDFRVSTPSKKKNICRICENLRDKELWL